MQPRESLPNRLLEKSLCLCLFLLLFELGAGTSYYLLEISLGALILAAAFYWLVGLSGDLPALFALLRERLRGAWLAATALLIYLAWDALTLVYTQSPALAYEKYRVVLLMCFIGPCILLMCRSGQQVDALLLTTALAGLTLAVGAVLNFLVLPLFPVPYALRLSLRTDYNMFAITILLGLLCGVFLTLWSRYSIMTKAALLGVQLTLQLPVLYLSGSRRAFLLLWVILPILLVAFVVQERCLGRPAKQIGAAAVLLCLTVGSLSTLYTMAMSQQMEKVMAEGGHPAAINPGSGDTSPEERYQTAVTGGMLGKRKVLWRIALEDAQNFSPTQWVLGKGNGYDILLYDRSLDAELVEQYPDTAYRMGKLSAHNLFLADFLGGGLPKVIILSILLATLGWQVLLLLLGDPLHGLLYALTLGIVVVGNLISNRFGLLYDKCFTLFALLVMVEYAAIKQGRRRVNGGKGRSWGA